MNGNIHLVSFFISPRCQILDSIFSPLLLALSNQNIKSNTSITVIIITHSQLMEK
jgi:hypothetical protein